MTRKTKLTLTVNKVNLSSKIDKEGTLHKELIITAHVPFTTDRLAFFGSKIGEPLAADLEDYQAKMTFSEPGESSE